MKTKFITLFALVLCMSAFLIPMTAYAAAAEDTTPPTVSAWLDGDILHIEASDTGTGVEAVYVSGSRYNYRVDGALELDAPEVAGDGEQISVYAVDFAGNESESVTLDNPYYTAPAAAAESTGETESAIPAEASDGQAFTTDGTGTVLDDIVEQNGKEFFSIVTEAGNVFYLIIDRYGESENVYLLNAVTEDDLMALAETSSDKSESAIPTTSTTTPEPDVTETPTPVESETDGGGSNGTMIFIVIAVIVAGGAGYYIKIVRPKQQAVDSDEEYEDDEEMEFEDEPEEDEDGGEPETEDE